ncbi:MAG: porin [bacterium]
MATSRFSQRSALAALVLTIAAPAFAGPPTAASTPTAPAAAPASTDPTAQKLQELDQKVKVLERLREIDKETADAKKAEAVTVTANPKDGFSIKNADGTFVLKLTGLVQTDVRNFFDDTTAKLPTQFLVRRARPIIEGTVYKYFEFRLVPDFGGGAAVIQDAYADVKLIPELALRTGKFKAPVGLERLQSDSFTFFIEPGLPTALVPNRDVGAQLFGDIGNGVLTYQVGVFNGVADGASGDLDTFDDKDIDARIYAAPFKTTDVDALVDLNIGIAGTFGSQHGSITAPNLPSYRTFGQNTFFRYKTDATATAAATAAGTAYAVGSRTRFTPQLYWAWDSFSTLAEYVHSTQKVKLADVAEDIPADAWSVSVGYVVTGEKASFKGVQPAAPFDPANGGWGAVELVARYGDLTIDDKAFDSKFADIAKSAKEAKEWGVGANWYLTKIYKIALDYGRTEFDGGAKGGDRETENAILTRLQAAF